MRTRIVRNGPSAGKKMAIATLHDKTGSIEAVIFSQAYARHARLIGNDAIVALFGRLDRSRGEASIIVDEVVPIEDLPRRFAGQIELDLIEGPDERSAETMMRRLEAVLRAAGNTANGGRSVRVLLNIDTHGKRVALRPHGLRIALGDEVVRSLQEILGPANVRVGG